MARSSHQIAHEAISSRQAMQKPRELALMIDLVRERPIRNVLEIGGMFGGTMWAWSQFATGQLICVDLFVLEGRMDRADDVGFTLVNVDSRLPETRVRVQEILDGEPIDLLFVDGDHRYEAVKADAANWLPLLSSSGIAGFHDIGHRWIPEGDPEGHGHHDMWRFWTEVRAGRRAYEIFDSEHEGHWGGIGVLLGADAPPLRHRSPLLHEGMEPPAQSLPVA